MTRALLAQAVVLSSIAIAACGGPEVRHPYKADDNTPANSISETRLAGEDPNRPKTTSTSSSEEADPTAPMVNKVSDMPKADDSGEGGGGGGAGGKGGGKKGGGKKGGGGAAVASDKPEPAEKPSKSGPKVSRAECDQVLEKALELEIGSRPEFEGIDKKELIAQTKAMAKQQHGNAPCDATRSQYNCAMAATSTAQWKRCMQ